MEYLTILLTIASVISALGTIIACFKAIHAVSDKGIDKRINKTVKPMFEEIQGSIDNVNDKMRESQEEADKRERQHLRYECLCFASDLRKGIPKTRQEYEEIFRMEDNYNRLIDKYNIKNGFMHEEMAYIHAQYQSLSKIKKSKIVP